MSQEVNQEEVNDRAKLIMHRLAARRLAHDPALVDAARNLIAFWRRVKPGYEFHYESWERLLDLPLPDLRRVITERSDRMCELRNTSPFPLAMKPYFFDVDFRKRIWRKARTGFPCVKEARHEP